MKRMPNEINARISKFAELCVNQDINPDVIAGLISCDKICYYTDIQVLPTFKVPEEGNIESFIHLLNERWVNKRDIFCFQSAFMSPSMYDPDTLLPTKVLMISGSFIKVDDDFVIPEIVDRNKRIDSILDESN